MTLPYRAAGILLNGKEADLKQHAGSVERQSRVHSRWVAGTQNMNYTQRWLARVRPRHTSAENALIANMRTIHISHGWIVLRQCATTPANAGRMTQAYNRSLRAYGSGTNAGMTGTSKARFSSDPARCSRWARRCRWTCRLPRSGGFLCGIENLPAFDLTEHATKARAIRNLGHAVGDHRDRCPCPDHHCRRLVRDSTS